MSKKIVSEIAKELYIREGVVERIVRHPFKIIAECIRSKDDYSIIMLPFFGKFIPFRNKNFKNSQTIETSDCVDNSVAIVYVRNRGMAEDYLYVLGKPHTIKSFKIKVVIPWDVKYKYTGKAEEFIKDYLYNNDPGLIRRVSV